MLFIPVSENDTAETPMYDTFFFFKAIKIYLRRIPNFSLSSFLAFFVHGASCTLFNGTDIRYSVQLRTTRFDYVNPKLRARNAGGQQRITKQG